MSYAFCCGVCDEPDPMWRIDRTGDAVCSWACAEHLSVECDRLQRDHEITELVVRLHWKAVEWNEMRKLLDDIAAAGPGGET